MHLSMACQMIYCIIIIACQMMFEGIYAMSVDMSYNIYMLVEYHAPMNVAWVVVPIETVCRAVRTKAGAWAC